MNTSYSLPIESRTAIISEGLWLRSRTWDLTFISLSAVLVLIPFLAFFFANEMAGSINRVLGGIGVAFRWDEDASRNFVNGLIALFIGGPHMYATYTRTLLEKSFSRKHSLFLAASLVIPVAVIYLGVQHFQVLITVFFFWASVHIMHQLAFIMECYNQKAKEPPTLISRLIDYAAVFSSLYPIAVYRFVHDEFRIGANKLLYPDFLKNEYVFYFVTAIFVASIVLFIWKTILEMRAGTAHYPKILLMSLTIVIAFFIPAFRNLDVAFQGFNAWHSFQYLGLTYYINRLRHERGEIATKFIDKMSEDGKTWMFYGFNVALTAVAVTIISVLIYFSAELGLSFDQCYYIVVLSFLLMHYFHDHLLFTSPEVVTKG